MMFFKKTQLHSGAVWQAIENGEVLSRLTAAFVTRWWASLYPSNTVVWQDFDSSSTQQFFKSKTGLLLKISLDVNASLYREIDVYHSIHETKDFSKYSGAPVVPFFQVKYLSNNSIHPPFLVFKYEEGFVSAWDLIIEESRVLPENLNTLYSKYLLQGCELLSQFYTATSENFVHEDFHLGQFGRTQDLRWIVFDFEGLPFQNQGELSFRWMDYACLVRSLCYAWRSTQRSKPPIQEWVSKVVMMLNPQANSQAAVKILLQLIIRRCVYEIRYEEKHRPDWLWIPQSDLELLKSIYLSV